MKRIIDIPEEKYNQIINFYQGSKARPKDYEIAILNSLSLEQETVIDKIRAEIEQWHKDGTNWSDIRLMKIEDILDKYRTESEG